MRISIEASSVHEEAIVKYLKSAYKSQKIVVMKLGNVTANLRFVGPLFERMEYDRRISKIDCVLTSEH